MTPSFSCEVLVRSTSEFRRVDSGAPGVAGTRILAIAPDGASVGGIAGNSEVVAHRPPVDITDPAATVPLFLRFVVYPAAVRDPDLLRAVARRLDALDPVDRLAAHPELLDRARALDAERAADRPVVPPRSLILAALAG